MKGIVFLTSTNLACNPRCLKEVELALEMGYQVSVFAFEFDNWTKEIESSIRKRLHGVRYHSIKASPNSFFTHFFTFFVEKVARILYRSGWRSKATCAVAMSKRSFSIYLALRKAMPECDLIIAHNPGAFYPAWWLSNKTGTPFAIDIEDFHPGENNELVVRKSVIDIMQAYLPAARYVSFASPLIQKATLNVLKSKVSEPFVINNVFSEQEFPKPLNPEQTPDKVKLKLIWFSQHISFGRGLEDILPQLVPYEKLIQLTLIGNSDSTFKRNVLDNYSFVVLKDPLPQTILNAELGKHDIGLALESNSVDENRKICLTNKIWAYLQAGLYIWATDTPAQKEFSLQFPQHVSLFSLTDADTLYAVIQNTMNTLADIRSKKVKRWEINQVISWEKEKGILEGQWESIINMK